MFTELGEAARRKVTRRDFVARYLGNLALATGGTLFGSALAYELYRRRSVDSLSDLKQGLPLRSAANAESAEQTAPAASSTLAASPSIAAAARAALIATPLASTPGEEPPIFVATVPAEDSPQLTAALVPVRLRIDSIGLTDAKVVEMGTKIDKGQLVWETPDHAVGYLRGTGVPGKNGNLVLGGHISSPIRGEGNIFRNLPNLKNKIGSKASVQTADGTWYHYAIVGTDVVTPADTWVLDPTPDASVTLLTCVPDGVYTYRFIARGHFVGTS